VRCSVGWGADLTARELTKGFSDSIREPGHQDELDTVLGSAVCRANRTGSKLVMSFAPNLIELPVDGAHVTHDRLACELLDAVSFAADVAGGMRRVVNLVRREARAKGVDWWGAGEDGALTRIVTSGGARGGRVTVPLERAGVLVVHGGRVSGALDSALSYVAPVVRRRVNEEHLARAGARLARRNEALDEFAALVAHELRTPLHAALAGGDPTVSIGEALDLVELLLAAAQTGTLGAVSTDVAGCLDRAVGSLGGAVAVASDLPVPVPLPPGPLFVILRNLLSNAAAAGARNVLVSTEGSYRGSRLVVEDDGAGLAAGARYATGSRVGLPLCRQIAARSGGVLELASRAPSGSRATLTFALRRAR
jgi:signal transduction histidine kinase